MGAVKPDERAIGDEADQALRALRLSARSRPPRSTVRWSFQSSAGRTTLPSASRKTEPCICPLSPTAGDVGRLEVGPGQDLADGRDRSRRHQRSGSCSDQPGLRIGRTGYSAELDWRGSSPDSSIAIVFVPDVPMSMPSVTLTDGSPGDRRLDEPRDGANWKRDGRRPERPTAPGPIGANCLGAPADPERPRIAGLGAGVRAGSPVQDAGPDPRCRAPRVEERRSRVKLHPRGTRNRDDAPVTKAPSRRCSASGSEAGTLVAKTPIRRPIFADGAGIPGAGPARWRPG